MAEVKSRADANLTAWAFGGHGNSKFQFDQFLITLFSLLKY